MLNVGRDDHCNKQHNCCETPPDLTDYLHGPSSALPRSLPPLKEPEIERSVIKVLIALLVDFNMEPSVMSDR